jgi:hypothetical protein
MERKVKSLGINKVLIENKVYIEKESGGKIKKKTKMKKK